MNQLQTKQTNANIIANLHQTIDQVDIYLIIALLTTNFWDKVVSQLTTIEATMSKKDNSYHHYTQRTINAIRQSLTIYLEKFKSE